MIRYATRFINDEGADLTSTFQAENDNHAKDLAREMIHLLKFASNKITWDYEMWNDEKMIKIVEF